MILSPKECLRGEFQSRMTLEDLKICYTDLDRLALMLHLLLFLKIYCIYEIFGPSVPDICITESVEGKY